MMRVQPAAVLGVLLLTAAILLAVGPVDRSPRVPASPDPPVEPAACPDRVSDGAEVPAGKGAISGTVRSLGEGTAAEVRVFLDRPVHPEGPPTWFYDFAPVEALRPPPRAEPPVRACRSAADGTYGVEGLSPGRYEVVAESSEGGRGATIANLRVPGARVRADVELRGGTEVLHGRALWADGRPFLGWVSATEELAEWSTGRLIELGNCFSWTGLPEGPSVLTGPDGRFRIPALEPGLYRLSCRQGGRFRSRGGCVRLPRREDVELVVDRGLGTVSGVVRGEPDGEAIAGAKVWVVGESPTSGVDCAVATATAADGTFSLPAPRGRRILFADAKGRLPCGRALPSTEDTVEVRLARAARLRGTVVDAATGRPVPGARTILMPSAEWDAEWRHPFRSTTADARGCFAFEEVPSGEVALLARGRGYISPQVGRLGSRFFNPMAAHLLPGEEAVVDVPVVAAVTVGGRVVDAAGEPVAGAWVTARLPGSLDSSGANLVAGRVEAYSGPDGRFALSPVCPGQVYLVEANSGESGSASVKLEPVRPGAVPDLVLTLAEPGWLDLRVVDEEAGAPLAGTTVRLLDRQHRETGSPDRTTDSDGRARFPLPGGRELVVDVHLPGREAVGGRVEVESPAEVTVRMRRVAAGRKIAGTVRFTDGTVPFRGSVSCSPLAGEGWWTVPLDEAGGFRLTGLSESKYRLSASAERGDGEWFSAGLDVEVGSRDVELVLSPKEQETEARPDERTVFRVLGPDGEPVASGTLLVRDDLDKESNKEPRQWNTDRCRIRDGTVRASLKGRTERIWVEVHGACGPSGVRLAAGALLAGPMDRDAPRTELSLPLPRSIEGVVRDGAGRGVRGLTVLARPRYPIAVYWSQVHAKSHTGPDGAFRLDGLGDLECEVVVGAAPGFVQPEPVPVRPGGADLEITLESSFRCRIRVEDPDGEPVSEAIVRANRAGSRRGLGSDTWVPRGVDGRAGPDGVVLLDGLSADGTYDLYASAPGFPKDVFSRTIPDWRPADATVRLERGLTVSGVALLPDGSPAPEVIVRARQDHGIEKFARSGPAGEFEVGPFREGAVHVLAEPERKPGSPPEFPDFEKAVEVPAGSRSLRITVVGADLWTLSLRIVGPPSLGDDVVLVSVDRERADPWEWSGSGRAFVDFHAAGERFLVERLDGAFTYTLFACQPRKGLCFYRRGITKETPEIDLVLVPGNTIRGRLLLPPDAKWFDVSVLGRGWSIQGAGGTLEADGSFEIRGVPPGPCRVHGRVERRDGTESELEVAVTGAQPVTIDLR